MFASSEEESQFKQEKQKLIIWMRRRLKGLVKASENFINELENCSKWISVQHEATLLQSNFFLLKRGQKEILVEDWEKDNQKVLIKLDSKLEPAEEIALRFKKSKKMKKGIEPLSKLVVKANAELNAWGNFLLEAESVQDWIPLVELKKMVKFPSEGSKSTPLVVVATPFNRFESEAGLEIFVGKSARSNDKLTFQHATGNDWWFHVNSFSGSHVVLKVHKGQEPDQDSIVDAMQLALFHSKAKNQGEAEICVTQRKYVSRIKSAVGKVQISKHKNYFIKLDLERVKLIKQRK